MTTGYSTAPHGTSRTSETQAFCMTAVVVSGLVTLTSQRKPAGSVGVSPVISVSLETFTFPAGYPSKSTVAPAWKSWPLIVNGVAVSGDRPLTIAGPCVGEMVKRLLCEISDVLPRSSVAVAEIQTFEVLAIGYVRSNVPLPCASVTTGANPIHVFACKKSVG